jgi:translocation and assembly module TamA
MYLAYSTLLARCCLLIVLMATTVTALAKPLVTSIDGVEGPLLANVRAHLSLAQAETLDEISVWRLRQMASDARSEIEQALRPFGHYQPAIKVRLIEPDSQDEGWQAFVEINPGEPVTIGTLDLKISGPGADHPDLVEWKQQWPLGPGKVLNHQQWEAGWRAVTDIANDLGFFNYQFAQRSVVVDPRRQQAEIHLHVDTGPRFRFSGYSTEPIAFRTDLLDRLTIIEPDEPYNRRRVDEQREILARAGLFDRIVVEEQRDADTATVNLHYRLEARPRDSYRATLGFGTDTGARAQLGWIRHYLSSRGNLLDAGIGFQQADSEYVLRTEYLHPRGSRPGSFFSAGGVLRSQKDDFRFNDENRSEPVFDAFSGRREQAELWVGRLEERLFWRHRFQSIEERLFIALLNESFDAFSESSLSVENEGLLDGNPSLRDFLQTETNTIALGATWRLPNIVGTGFQTRGYIAEGRLLGAHESLGSDVSFAQAWLRGRWHGIFGGRHKVLLAAEIGFTEADTDTLNLAFDDRTLDLSITELPERYRFKTGGDRSVRGYGFEALSTNRNGANHTLAASAEYEFRVGQNWSLAAFYDVGNAFNDWDNRKLKRGIGAGFRWYTLIGPIQLDFAQALDDAGKPWRIHFTIGTRLL